MTPIPVLHARTFCLVGHLHQPIRHGARSWRFVRRQPLTSITVWSRLLATSQLEEIVCPTMLAPNGSIRALLVRKAADLHGVPGFVLE